MKATTTFVLVIDGSEAKVFRNDGPGRGLAAVEAMSWERVGGQHARDLGSDRPGRSFARAGAHARHGLDPREKLNRADKKAFLDKVITAIEAAQRRRQFDRLIVVAPPRVLGEVRALLPEALDRVVLGEVKRDLVHAPLADVAKHVGACLAV